MFKLWGATHVTNTYADIGFRSIAGWKHLDAMDGLDLTCVLLGDADQGPAIALAAAPPGAEVRTTVWAHASDNFRMPLLGEVVIGRERYQPGDFRFQRGWVPHPSHSRKNGPEPGWEVVLFADRRRARIRFADEPEPDDPQAHDAEPAEVGRVHGDLARFIGLGGDFVSDDAEDAPRSSFLATTLGDLAPRGRLDGSFADQECYLPVTEHARAAFALMGDAEVGPVVVLASTDPLQMAMPAARFPTEVFRLVLSGSCDIAGQVYEAGDARVQSAGTWCEPVHAGPDGLEEVIVLGDRRLARPQLAPAEGWAAALGDVVEQLGLGHVRWPADTDRRLPVMRCSPAQELSHEG